MRDAQVSRLTMFCILVGIIAVLCWLAVTLDKKLGEARYSLRFAQHDLKKAQERVAETEAQTLALVDKVTPLIAKSDWMTGRWGGQFNALVQMENKRNELVDTTRKALWDIPFVADYINEIGKKDA